jgi:hypothetical protein
VVRPDGVETDSESVEFSLLAPKVFFWRTSRFVFEGAVHTLVPTVLAGTALFDPDWMDAELEPPD